MRMKTVLLLVSFWLLAQSGCSGTDGVYRDRGGAAGSSGGGGGASQQAVPGNVQTIMPAAAFTPHADLMVTDSMHNQKISLLVGETVFVTLPIDQQKSKVELDRAILADVNAESFALPPGMAGWLFKALKPGETELRIVMNAAPLPKYEFLFYMIVKAQP